MSRLGECARPARRAELAAWGERPGRLISRSREELTEMLGLVDATYQSGPPSNDMSVLTHDGARVPGGPSGVGDDVVALPVRAHGRDLGHFVLVFPHPTVGVSVSVDRRHEAVAVADQLGMVLRRYEYD